MMRHESAERCYCCGKVLPKSRRLVNVAGEDQEVFVGADCFRMISAAGASGHKPKIGPRLYAMEFKPQ